MQPVIASRNLLRKALRTTRESARQLKRLRSATKDIVRRQYRSLAGTVGHIAAPPWVCPGCGGFRKQRKLAACEGVVSQPAYRQMVFATGCPRCGLLWSSPRSNAPTLYTPSGEWAQTHGVEDETRRFFLDKHLWAAVDTITGVASPAPDARAFDFGCGNGRWLDTLARAGWRTSGLDVSLKSAFTRHSELTEVPRSPTFGFVVVSQVLEHLTHPGDVLAQLAAATLPNGWIFISVPSLDRLPVHRDWHYVLNAHTHLAAFSVDCLSTLLARVGFGAPHVIPPPQRAKLSNTPKRLQLVAQKGAQSRPAAEPLTAALDALRAFRNGH